MSTVLNLLAAALLVLLNGFFVAAEFALVKVRSTRIAELAKEGSASARMTMHAVHHLDAYLSATQLGITFTSIGLGWIGEPAIGALLEPLFHSWHVPESLIHPISFGIAFAIVSAAHIVVGELAPKSWAIQRPEAVSLWVSYPLHGFYWLFRPAISLLNGAARLLLRLIGIRAATEHELAHTEEELRMILTASGESGVLKVSEVDLVKHVFEFADKKAGEIMVPRVDMIYMDATWPLDKNLELMAGHTYTRYPLCEGGPDHILGMIHVKDLVKLQRDGGSDLRSIKRELLFIPESKSIDQLLREFQLRKLHMAAVVDEYGGTAGIATLEDVLEQIVGEIHDEFEEPVAEIQPLEDGRYLIDGRALLTDLRAQHDIELANGEAETVGGWVLERLGAIPKAGAVAESDGFSLEVREVDSQRVRKVVLSRQVPVTAAPLPAEA